MPSPTVELNEAFARRMSSIFAKGEPQALELVGKLLSTAVPALVQMAEDEWAKVGHVTCHSAADVRFFFRTGGPEPLCDAAASRSGRVSGS